MFTFTHYIYVFHRPPSSSSYLFSSQQHHVPVVFLSCSWSVEVVGQPRQLAIYTYTHIYTHRRVLSREEDEFSISDRKVSLHTSLLVYSLFIFLLRYSLFVSWIDEIFYFNVKRQAAKTRQANVDKLHRSAGKSRCLAVTREKVESINCWKDNRPSASFCK